MAKAFSKLFTADTQDVLAGSVVGVLGSAPSYDVEVRVVGYNPTSSGSNTSTSANAPTVTLLLNGVAILQGCRGFVANAGGNGEPRSDAPLVSFSAPGGSRLTLNLDVPASTEVSVYVEARESMAAPDVPTLVHMLRTNVGANATVADILAGTVVAQVPADATYEVSLMISSDGGEGSEATMLIDSDTVCESFEIPFRSESLAGDATERDQFGAAERDTVITTLATAGSAITLNLANTNAAARNIVSHVTLTPVA